MAVAGSLPFATSTSTARPDSVPKSTPIAYLRLPISVSDSACNGGHADLGELDVLSGRQPTHGDRTYDDIVHPHRDTATPTGVTAIAKVTNLESVHRIAGSPA